MSQTSLIYLAPTKLAAVEVLGPYPLSVPRAWEYMFAWLTRSQNHELPGRGYGLAFDDPRSKPEAGCRYLAGVAVPERWHPCDGNIVSLARFSGGAYAWRQHRGRYENMGAAVSSVREEWLPMHGLMLDSSRPVVTIYYDDPRSVPCEDRIADVCVPVIADSGLIRKRA